MDSIRKKKFDIPSHYYLKSYENDSFFCSMAEGLNNIRTKLQLTSKQLRAKCKTYLYEQMQDQHLKQRATTLLRRRSKCNTMQEYYFNIENSAEDSELFGIEVMILGQPDVEGRFICEMFNVQIHTVESVGEDQWKHQIISKDAVRDVHPQKINYKNKDLIHVIKNIDNYQLVVSVNSGDLRSSNFGKKRAGTVDWGRTYEEGILAHIAIKCSLDEQVEDFELYNNFEGMGDFDDVVLKVKYQDEREGELYLIQLKHKQQTKVNIRNVFENKDNIFYLPKYEESFNQICSFYHSEPDAEIFENIEIENIKFVLFSNVNLNSDNGSKFYYLNKETNCSGITKLLSTKENEFPYTIRNNNQEEKIKISNEFLSNCWIYLNQINANKIENLLENDLDYNIHPDKIKIILNYFAKWTRQKANEKITKSNMINIIMQNCLPQHDIRLSLHKNVENYSTIVDTLTNKCFFPYINKSHLEILKYSIIKEMESYLDIKVNTSQWLKEINYETIKNKTQITDFLKKRKIFSETITYNNLYYWLWQIKKLPMLIEFNEENTKPILFVLEKFKNCLESKSFVLVYDNNPPNMEELNKIINLDLLDKVLISFQGKKPIKLQELISDNKKVLNSITPEVLITLLTDVKIIGKTCELIPYYVPRKIKHPVLRQSILNEHKHLFILKDKRYANIEDYVSEYERYFEKNSKKSIKLEYKNVNVLHSDLSVEKSFECLNRIKKENIHFLIKQNKGFRLIKSYGSISSLRKHLIEEDIYVVNEEFILHTVKNRINIICSTAGMGKTCLLQSIENSSSPKEWTIYLNLNEHVCELDSFDYIDGDAEIIEYLCQYADNFVKELFLATSKSGYVTLLLDGYDEVIFKKVAQFTEWVLHMNMKMWITTRPSRVAELEDALGLFSMEIKHFDQKDQTQFLKQFYQENDTAKEALEYCKSFESNLIGIPLQIKLLADVLLSENVFKLDPIYLYERFLNKKIVELGKHKHGVYKNFCKKMSLSLFFTKELLENCNFDFLDLNERITEFQEEHKKDFIISGFTKDKTPMFVHRTYAEFLAAQYLYEQLTKQNLRNKKQWEILHEKLFYMEMIDVRYFLDMIATKNCELHRAVLNNDIKLVKKLLRNENGKNLIEEKDDLGRTALELACSYGKRFDLDTKEDISGLVNLEKHVEILFSEEDQSRWKTCKGIKISVPFSQYKFTINVEIVNELVSIKKINIPLDVAIKTGSLELLEYFSNDFQINQLSKTKIKMLLYHCSVNNFSNIINSISSENLFNKFFKRNNFLNVTYNEKLLTHIAAVRGNFEACAAFCKKGAKTKDSEGRKLLHVAAENGQVEFIEKMLKQLKNFNETVNERTDDCNGWTPLHRAVECGHLDIVNLLLSNKADVNIRTKQGQHVLNLSFSFGYLEIAECLLRHCGIHVDCINEQDINGWTPWHHAVARSPLFNLLLLKGANINVKTKQQQTVLHLACLNGAVKVVEQLLQLNNFDKNYVNETDDSNWTPLHYAVVRGHMEVLNLLLLKGANVNMLTSQGEHLLHLACSKRYGKINTDIVERLLQHTEIDVNCKKDDRTTLHHVVDLGNLYVLNLLLLNGADTNIRTEKGDHVLHSACLSGKTEIVQRLLQHDGIDVNCKKRDNGWTPLHIAIHKGCLDIVRLLLLSGAKAHGNILHMAYSPKYGNDNIQLLQCLLQHLDINCLNDPTPDGTTLLHRAVNWGHLDVLEFLIKNKANVNIKTKKGEHLLHLACSPKYSKVDIKIVQRLLEHAGINVNVTNDENYGMTPLHVAATEGHLEILKLLLTYGADTFIKTYRGEDVMDLALEFGHAEIVKRLLQVRKQIRLNSRYYVNC